MKIFACNQLIRGQGTKLRTHNLEKFEVWKSLTYSLQYVESIHAPDLRIRFLVMQNDLCDMQIYFLGLQNLAN
jgi:hypothetical protein